MERVVSTLLRSVAASALVFAVELTGVALLDHARVPAAIAFAAVQIVGTTLTFVLNKFWAFAAARTGRGYFEGAKSAVVFAGSFCLNIALPSIATYCFAVVPVVAFTVSQIVVGLAWNFPLNRWWVFDAALHKESSSCC